MLNACAEDSIWRRILNFFWFLDPLNKAIARRRRDGASASATLTGGSDLVHVVLPLARRLFPHVNGALSSPHAAPSNDAHSCIIPGPR